MKLLHISYLGLLTSVCEALTTTQSAANITLANVHLKAVLDKSSGSIIALTLDGQDLLGPQVGATGVGPYLDSVSIPGQGFYQPGADGKATYQVISDKDASGIAYGGIVMTGVYKPTNQTYQQYWFLRDDETGLHMFTRVMYYNATTPFLRNLQELRTCFRPSTRLWTHLMTNDRQYAPLPSSDGVSKEVVVQDATWSLAATPNDPYFKQESSYFTKYSFSDDWRTNNAHGIYSDGSKTKGMAYGAWLVMNTKDTYFDGPIHSDLTVDGIVYNYLVSNHHGNGTPNITNGFDRTFGPQYYYFNKGMNATLPSLKADATQYADSCWNAAFYDSIAKYVPGYVPTSGRGSFQAQVNLPAGASRPIAVLSVNKAKFQDNTIDPKAYQYWADIDSNGNVAIPRVKAGTYRLTIYADGVFGWYTQDIIVINASKVTANNVTWTPDSAGTELWRIGTPDKSAGEYRHGYTPDPSHPLHPAEHRIFWGAYDFTKDFPNGVRYTVGQSDPATDLNYIHWSVFGQIGNQNPPLLNTTRGKLVSDWKIFFNITSEQLAQTTNATFTIQLAGAKTAAGNTDTFNTTEQYNNIVHTTVVNNNVANVLKWTIPYYHSSSCGARSWVSCYQLEQKFTFPSSWLRTGSNQLTLRLPENATDYESAVLPTSIYVQYDALRMEIQ